VTIFAILICFVAFILLSCLQKYAKVLKKRKGGSNYFLQTYVFIQKGSKKKQKSCNFAA